MEGESETVEVGSDLFILLEFAREWPKYVVTWTVRRRAGESDYPVTTGSVERMPPAPTESADDAWRALRASALQAATAAADVAGEVPDAGSGWLGRVFSRRNG